MQLIKIYDYIYPSDLWYAVILHLWYQLVGLFSLLLIVWSLGSPWTTSKICMKKILGYRWKKSQMLPSFNQLTVSINQHTLYNSIEKEKFSCFLPTLSETNNIISGTPTFYVHTSFNSRWINYPIEHSKLCFEPTRHGLVLDQLWTLWMPFCHHPQDLVHIWFQILSTQTFLNERWKSDESWSPKHGRRPIDLLDWKLYGQTINWRQA